MTLLLLFRVLKGLPYAPVVMEHDDSSTEQSTAIALNIKHNPYILTYSLTMESTKNLSHVNALFGRDSR